MVIVRGRSREPITSPCTREGKSEFCRIFAKAPAAIAVDTESRSAGLAPRDKPIGKE
jgi:hypothetical protein